tara:strand:- start:888 stop:1181 length:294 start_codon:yes stop_codon:yes gene_type:complete
MAKIINFSDHFRREQSENKLRRIKQQLNSALGLNLSDDSIRYLMTEPGVNMKDPKTKSPEQLTLFDFLPTDKEQQEIEFISDDGDEFTFELEPDYDA